MIIIFDDMLAWNPNVPTTARWCLYWLVVPASGVQNGGLTAANEALHTDDLPCISISHNGDAVGSTVLLAAFALLIFIDLARKGTWTKFVTLKNPKYLKLHFGIWEHLQFHEKKSKTKFIIKKTGGLL